jgi:hypothetical protein
MPDQRAPSTMRLIVRAPTWVPRASAPIQMLAGFGLQRAIGNSRNRACLTSGYAEYNVLPSCSGSSKSLFLKISFYA